MKAFFGTMAITFIYSHQKEIWTGLTISFIFVIEMQSKEFVTSCVHIIIKGQQEALCQPVQYIYFFSKSTSRCVPTNVSALNMHSKRKKTGQLWKGIARKLQRALTIIWKLCHIGHCLCISIEGKKPTVDGHAEGTPVPVRSPLARSSTYKCVLAKGRQRCLQRLSMPLRADSSIACYSWNRSPPLLFFVLEIRHRLCTESVKLKIHKPPVQRQG